MSSLAATQSDGYYVPPEYYNSGQYKKKPPQKFNHPNHKGHNQYLTSNTVRFELPHDGFCTSCDCHVAKGTRFNARKTHVDDYFTTKIWEFTTKCRSCGQCQFAIRTNPKERTFDYVRGIRKKHEEFDTVEAGTIGVVNTDESNRLESYSCNTGTVEDAAAANPLDKLDREAHGQRTSMTERDALEALRTSSLSRGGTVNDARSNSTLRALYRKERRSNKRNMDHAHSLGLGRGISVGTQALSPDEAGRVTRVFDPHGPIQIGRRDASSRRREREAFRTIRTGSIFDGGNNKSRRVMATNDGGKKRRRRRKRTDAVADAGGEGEDMSGRSIRMKRGDESHSKEAPSASGHCRRIKREVSDCGTLAIPTSASGQGETTRSPAVDDGTTHLEPEGATDGVAAVVPETRVTEADDEPSAHGEGVRSDGDGWRRAGNESHPSAPSSSLAALVDYYSSSSDDDGR